MMYAGAKKCIPAKRFFLSSVDSAVPIAFTLREDVFEQSTQVGLHISDSRENRSFFTARFSNTASTIRSQAESSGNLAVVRNLRVRASCADDEEIFLRATAPYEKMK